MDPVVSQDLLSWDSLRFDGMKATSSPPSFVAAKVALTDCFARVELDEAGNLNFRRAFGLAEPPPVDDAAAESALAGGKPADPPPPRAAQAPPGESASPPGERRPWPATSVETTPSGVTRWIARPAGSLA